MSAHCTRECTCARGQRDVLIEYGLECFLFQTFEQTDTLLQRRLEFEFTSHRALGDIRDPGPLSHILCKFVDTFLADQR